jgi:hypothetical protein
MRTRARQTHDVGGTALGVSIATWVGLTSWELGVFYWSHGFDAGWAFWCLAIGGLLTTFGAGAGLKATSYWQPLGDGLWLGSIATLVTIGISYVMLLNAIGET